LQAFPSVSRTRVTLARRSVSKMWATWRHWLCCRCCRGLRGRDRDDLSPQPTSMRVPSAECVPLVPRPAGPTQVGSMTGHAYMTDVWHLPLAIDRFVDACCVDNLGLIPMLRPDDFMDGDVSDAEHDMLLAATRPRGGHPGTRSSPNPTENGSVPTSPLALSSLNLLSSRTLCVPAHVPIPLRAKHAAWHLHVLLGPILISATQGTKRWRGGNPGHQHHHHHHPHHLHPVSLKAERWTTDLACRLALALHARLRFVGSVMVWHPGSVAGRPDADQLDPNHLPVTQFASSPWHIFLQSFAKHFSATSTPTWHIDVLGCPDRGGKHRESVQLGLAPLLHAFPDRTRAMQLQHMVTQRLDTAFNAHGFGLCRPLPEAAAMASDSHLSFSHQAVKLGIPAIQLILPRSVRLALVSNPLLFTAVVDALIDVYQDVLVLS
jgi:hypothetical protein